MQTLNPEQIIDLLPVNVAEADPILKEFEAAAPIECRTPGYCKRLVQEGFMTLTLVKWEGKRAYLLGWHITADHGFLLDLVQTLHSGCPMPVGIEATEELARKQGARYIRWTTLRKGIAKSLADRYGYQPEAVILTKVL